MNRIRVLIVDDSAVIRRLLKGALESDPDLEVVAAAVNGREALVRVRELSPDAVICDVEMPEMGGIETVQELRHTHPVLPVVMFSSPTVEGARTTLDCLHAGANDFVAKPSVTSGTAMAEVMAQLRNDLGSKIKALCRGPGDLSAVARTAVRAAPKPTPEPPPPVPAQPLAPSPVVARTPPHPVLPTPAPVVHEEPRTLRERPARITPPRPLPPPVVEAPLSGIRRSVRGGRIEAVLIGVSTGGPNALAELMPRLPRDLGVPVLIVQHMPPVFTRMLAERLSTKSQIPVHEAAAGDEVVAGKALLAPGDHHLVVRREGASIRCALNRDPLENSVRPAVDVLFRSAAQVWGGNVLVVIMTGMGQDGLLGAIQLHGLGAQVIAQDEASSVVWGMPGAVAKARIADRILPLVQIADEIALRVRGVR